jgi:hypothetical protein
MHRAARRTTVALGVVAAVLVLTPIGAFAQADVGAFCQARLDLTNAITAGDETSVEGALDALATTAPPEAQPSAQVLVDLFPDHGSHGLQTRKGVRATAVIDETVVAVCGFPLLDISGTDYEYSGVPESLVAGPQVMRFTNGAPEEHHELVLFQVKAGDDKPVRKILRLPDKKLSKATRVVAAAIAEPGDLKTLVLTLEPGRYIYACFLDEGTTSSDGEDHSGTEHGNEGAAPHWRQGMFGEFEVVGGA